MDFRRDVDETDLDQIIEEVDEFHTGTLTFERKPKNKHFSFHIFLTSEFQEMMMG